MRRGIVTGARTFVRRRWPCVLLAAASFASVVRCADRPPERLRVGENKRSLVTESGAPFLYLGDTAWELFKRLNREEAERYLTDRAEKGFTAVQAVALAGHGGLDEPNAYGHLPLLDRNPAAPAVRPGARDDYWDHVDFVIDSAARKGLYVGLAPAWAPSVAGDGFGGPAGIFTVETARRYGIFIGERYRAKTHVFWIIGTDRAAPPAGSQAIWRALAEGITAGVMGRNDAEPLLMTYLPAGPGNADDVAVVDEWCDFNTVRSSRGGRIDTWRMIMRAWDLDPAKPVLALETASIGLEMGKDQPGVSDDDVRRAAYWAVFAGACGYGYGHTSIRQMFAPGRYALAGARMYWYDALNVPSARQMGYLRALVLSRPSLNRIPDQSVLASDPGTGLEHARASRCFEGSFAMVYIPRGTPVSVNMDRLSGGRVRAWWFDPRRGTAKVISVFPKNGVRSFMPPSTGDGKDWVLVLDDATRRFSPPGRRPAVSTASAE